jgi:uncharacterized membrane protein
VELETIWGLPAHPLLVHVPVVLIPLCAIGAIAIVFIPTWRPVLGWILVVLAGFGTIAAQLASGSGEALEEALDEESDLLERHAELGETFIWFALVFFLVLLGFMVWDTMQRRRGSGDVGGGAGRSVTGSPVAIVLSVLLVLSGAAAGLRVYQVGHSGAKTVWQEDAGVFGNAEDGGG